MQATRTIHSHNYIWNTPSKFGLIQILLHLINNMASCSNINTLNQAEIEYSRLHGFRQILLQLSLQWPVAAVLIP